MPTENKKSCGLCSRYEALVNQGYWWCNAGHTENMDATLCPDYDGKYETSETTETTSKTIGLFSKFRPDGYSSSIGPKPMSINKIKKARKNRKKEKGIRHGRRN